MSDYADSSFLVSRYIADANTARVRDFVQRQNPTFLWTELHVLEVNNAFQLAIFRGDLDVDGVKEAMKLIRKDLRVGRLVRRKLPFTTVFRMAAKLSEAYSSTLGVRSLDLLHVGAAKALRVAMFASFDNRQRALAKTVGLALVP